MLLESTGAPISRPSHSELWSRLVEGEYDVMGRIQARIERDGPGSRSLRFGMWVQPSVTGKTPSLQAHTKVESPACFGDTAVVRSNNYRLLT